MNILYIAYSCAPNKGSEEKIGWNIPLESAKTNNVYVITKEEHRQKIEDYFDYNGNPQSIKFFYVDIPKIYKKIYKGNFYSARLNIWQKKAFLFAEKLCDEYKIDVIHQITPVELRSIGNYGKIPNVKFLCGPIGGGEKISKGLLFYAKVNAFFEVVRGIANKFSLLKYKINGAFKHCDLILFANEETRIFMQCKKNKIATLDKCITEIGIEHESFDVERVYPKDDKKCVFLVVGRLVYRKGHSFLLDALAKLPSDFNYVCKIVGNGKEFKKLQKKCIEQGIADKVEFVGKVSFEQINDIYSMADVLVMPSIRETTGSVLLEATSKAIPVITINKFGGPVLFDESSSWLYDGKNKREYINNLAVALEDCIKNPQKRIEKGKKAQIVALNHTWDKKIEKYNCIYEKIKRDI